MAHASHLNLDSSSLPGPASAPPTRDEPDLRDLLKYCAPATYDAARLYRLTRRPDCLPAVFKGVLMHYVEPEMRDRLRSPADDLRLREDLGLDSLTMMEIVIRLEDVLQISVRDDDLRQFRTWGEVRRLIERSLAPADPAPPTSAPP